MRAAHLMKNVALIVIVLLVGSLLRSIDSLTEVEMWRWRLGALVGWAAFSVAAMAAALMTGQLGDTSAKPVLGSAGLSRLAGCVMAGLALWLLSRGVDAVLVPAWRGAAGTVTALLLVALASYAIWVLYGQFEEIAASLRRFQVAPAAATVAAASPEGAAKAGGAGFCRKCGAATSADSRFCASCGTAREA